MNVSTLLSQNTTEFISLLDPGAVLPMTAEARLYDPLCLIVGPKAASRVLVSVGAEGVERMSATELSTSCDISPETAGQIVGARKLAQTLNTKPRYSASCPADAVAALPADLGSLEVEVVLAVALARDHRVKAIVLVSKGGDAVASFKARDLFRSLVRLGAAGVLLAHNHPGGSAIPSEEDVIATNTVAAAGELLGIPLLDHLIVARDETASFFELGLLPETEDRHALAAAESDGAP